MPVLEAGETLDSRRLRLSPLVAGAADAMSDWISLALAPDWQFEDFSRQVDADNATLISDLVSREAIGVAAMNFDQPLPRTASISFLTIDPERRYRGLGGEAGLAIDRQIRRNLGIDRVFVPIPDGRGLAVYFWLRLGFRPLQKSEAPWPLAGLSATPRPGIWLMRDQE